jgi:hypothetical protein
MVIMSEVPERLAGKGDRLDLLDSSEELLVDHA